MTIASRTPEGSPNHCPVCGHRFLIEPSQPLGDAPCPACGSLLWFVTTSNEQRLFDPEQGKMAELIAKRLGIPEEVVRESRLADLDLDSLELVEMVMDIESEAGWSSSI